MWRCELEVSCELTQASQCRESKRELHSDSEDASSAKSIEWLKIKKMDNEVLLARVALCEGSVWRGQIGVLVPGQARQALNLSSSTFYSGSRTSPMRAINKPPGTVQGETLDLGRHYA